MLKGHTTKVTSQEEGFPNFLKRLMTAGSPLMKSVPTPLAKVILIPLALSAGMPVADEAIQKKKLWIRYSSIDNLKLRSGRYYEDS